MGNSPRSIYKSQHRMRSSPRGNRQMVLPRQYVWRMAVDRLSLVDLWKTYVLPSLQQSAPHRRPHFSGLGEDHPVVRHHPAVYTSMISAFLTVLQSYKTSQLEARLDWQQWLTFTSISGISTSKISGTCSPLFSSSPPLSPILVATSSPGFIWSMIMAKRSPGSV